MTLITRYLRQPVSRQTGSLNLQTIMSIYFMTSVFLVSIPSIPGRIAQNKMVDASKCFSLFKYMYILSVPILFFFIC